MTAGNRRLEDNPSAMKQRRITIQGVGVPLISSYPFSHPEYSFRASEVVKTATILLGVAG